MAESLSDSHGSNNEERGGTEGKPTPNEIEHGDAPNDQDKDWEFDAPEWFLQHNIKVQADLVDFDTNILWTEDNHILTQRENSRKDGQQLEGKDGVNPKSPDASSLYSKQPVEANITSPTVELGLVDTANKISEANGANWLEKQQGPNSTAQEDKGQRPRYQYELSRNLYLELHDMSAGALVTNQNGCLDPDKSSILLRSDSAGSIEFTDTIIFHLAKEMKANVVSCDLGDLDDIVREFYTQEAKLSLKAEKSKHDESALETQHSSRTVRTQETKHDKELSLKFLVKSIESESSQSTGNDHTTGKEQDIANQKEQIHRVMSALLKALRIKNGQHQPQGIMDVRKSLEISSPIFIHLRHANHILDLSNGLNFFSSVRPWCENRRALGQKIILFVSISTGQSPFKGSCECSICQHEGLSSSEKSLRKELNVEAESALNVQAFDVPRDDTSLEIKRQRVAYTRKLRRGLRQNLAWKDLICSSDLLAPYPEWDFANSEEIAAVLDGATLSDENSQRAIRQICGRTLAKSKLEIDDIQIVLARIHRKQRDIDKLGEIGEQDQSLDFVPKSVQDKCDRHEKSLLSHIIDPKKLKTTYEDVIIDQETKETIKQLIALSKLRTTGTSHLLLEQLRIKGALFYGLPGTGKSHLSRAIAKESGANILAIDASNILDKWVGETEKLISAAFSLCTKLYPCILFIDEADSLFRRRASDDKSWERSAITMFLQRMDGFVTNEQSPFVIIATNRPCDIDNAVLRRLPHKVLFSLPSENEREQILRLFLKEEDMDSSIIIDKIVKDTPSFSGSDLRNLCGQAALAWSVDQVKSPQDAQSIENRRLLLTAQHFAKALERTRPSVSRQALKDIEDFQGELSTGKDNARIDVRSPPSLANRRMWEEKNRTYLPYEQT